MGGGYFNYQYQHLNYLADDIEGKFINNGKYIDEDYSADTGWNYNRPKKEFDRLNGATEEQREQILLEVNSLVQDLRMCSKRAKELEWLLSGDINIANYLKKIKEHELISDSTEFNEALKKAAKEYYKENVEGEPLDQDVPIECFIEGGNYARTQIKKRKI